MNNLTKRIERDLSEIFKTPVALGRTDETEKRECEFLLKQLRDVLMNIAIDEGWLKETWGLDVLPIPEEGIKNWYINTALSVISRLLHKGRQEEVSILLAEWKKDPFFRV